MAKMKQQVIRWDDHLGYWEVWQESRPIAHSRSLAVAQAHYPNALVLSCVGSA